jgi:hypothetical protein
MRLLPVQRFQPLLEPFLSRFYCQMMKIGPQEGDMFRHQDRSLIVIAKPR